MAEVTAALVRELRERTGAGMMDCKGALTETGGDIDEAIVYLRKKMGSKLSTREGRVAAEGIIAACVVDNEDAALIELNSETDFVARSADFRQLAAELAEQVARRGGHSVETVLAQESTEAPGATVKDRLHDVFTRLRENIVFKRFEFISTDACGAVATYVHTPAGDKIGVLVEVEAESADAARSEAVLHLARELAMQIAGARPKYLEAAEVTQAEIDRERDIARTQALNEGKPEAAVEKIVEGRLQKYYENVVLLNQRYQRDPKLTVSALLASVAGGVKVRRFVRYEVGELSTAEPPGSEA
ncbi:MAG: elongation factor Ts [Armatimonadetes bacterium]|nr:elongation factor Ts [Armatimonadota bacterium]MDE2207888.1 elongation factor Ts [Armatimonadota bacterium]